MAKIQRQDVASTICPPKSGPGTVAMPVHAVHVPIARPRSPLAEGGDDHASVLGTRTAPATP